MKKSVFILIAILMFQASNAFAAKGFFVSSGNSHTKSYQRFDQTKMRKSGNTNIQEAPFAQQVNKKSGENIIDELKRKPSKQEYDQAQKMAKMFQGN